MLPSSSSRTQSVNKPGRRATTTVAEAIERYTPHKLADRHWDEVAPFVKACVADLDPPTTHQAREWMRTVLPFVLWCREHGWPLEREVLFTPDNIELYASTGLTKYARSSIATRRSALRRIARDLTTNAPWPPAPREIPSAPRHPPYSAEEVAGYRGLTQRTPLMQRRLEVTLALGLGAGLSASEYYLAQPTNLRREGTATILCVPGRRPRDVPVRESAARVLWRYAEDDPEGYLLGSSLPAGDSSRLWHLLRQIDVPSRLPPLKTERLRSTWLVHHLDRCTPLRPFLEAAGLQGTRTINYLLPYLDDSPAARDHSRRLMAEG